MILFSNHLSRCLLFLPIISINLHTLALQITIFECVFIENLFNSIWTMEKKIVSEWCCSRNSEEICCQTWKNYTYIVICRNIIIICIEYVIFIFLSLTLCPAQDQRLNEHFNGWCVLCVDESDGKKIYRDESVFVYWNITSARLRQN